MSFLFNKGGNEALKKASDEFSKVQLPDMDQQKLQLQQYVDQGVITPEQAQTYLQGPSAANDITLDPKLKQAQYDALGSLQDIGNEGGLTATDRAKISQIQTDEDTKARGSREAILQNAQARGLGGSGIELLSQMQNQQDAATRASQRGTDVAAQAEQRALEALSQAGTLGGNMQQADFARQSDIAKANDLISQFNTQNKNQVGLANTQANNAAQQVNLENKQKTANSNVDLANSQQQYNKNLAQQNFQNEVTKASGAAGLANNQAQQANTDAASKRNLLGTGIAAVGTVLSDENEKKDIEEFNPSDFLDSLTSYKYKYKKPEIGGEGEHVGVMAQDLKKGAPQMVKETPHGKVVDYNKAGGPLFASLAHLHDRIKKLEKGGHHG